MQKPEVFFALAALVVTAILFGLGVYTSIVVGQNKLMAYRECVAANERMATMLANTRTETLRVSSLPSCHM